MKIDRSKLKKSTSEVPTECQALIEKLRSCHRDELLEELKKIDTWIFGKCELYHWIDILDICDDILDDATKRANTNSWVLSCDVPENEQVKELLLWVLHFTTLLIEHSFSRHLYNSMEHLITLLSSSDMHVILGVLNLLYMFSKRSNFIPRLNTDKRHALIRRLTHLAESWGGKENGFGLADCCKDLPLSSFPAGATTLHFEYYTYTSEAQNSPGGKNKNASNVVVSIHLDNVDQMKMSLGDIMDLLLSSYDVPEDKQMLLFTHLRLAHCFSVYEYRLQCVQARLQALSVLVYSNAMMENAHVLLYAGLLEELVELLELTSPHLVEIRAAALRTLTSIIHLERNPHVPNLMFGRRLNMIIDVTGAASYHGFLPVMVRTCITSLTANWPEKEKPSHTEALVATQPVPTFPLPLATALFSFLYHMASYEPGGEALVSCGMMESLLRVIKWPGSELEHITFVTRAVRVIDLITNIDMQAFQMHGGLSTFINRLELEVNLCRKEQPFVIEPPPKLLVIDLVIDVDFPGTPQENSLTCQEPMMDVDMLASTSQDNTDSVPKPSKPCLPQRAALLKSMLNFLKKAIQDPAFSDSIRHVMDGSLPSSLKHMISNAEYYGPSLFLLATDVVTVYVFQEPSLLSSLQDNGLTDVVLHALLVKDVPATREVLGSLPNVFSALCLNASGLASFVKCCPFERLFKVLLSPVYLAAMRRRRSSDPMGDTASNLGNAMDELMRHQPSLKSDATGAIIKLLEELCNMGRDPKYVCWRPQSKAEVPSAMLRTSTEGGSSDDEEEEDDDETSQTRGEETEEQPVPASMERVPIPLVDYILNVMKFVDAILSNNSTDDHCREFVSQKGLVPLMSILGLPNLPVDCPVTSWAQAVASVCKSILNLAHEPQVLEEGLVQMERVLVEMYKLINPRSYKDPIERCELLREIANATNPDEAVNNSTQTPLLHLMAALQGYIVMLIHICRTGQSDIRAINISKWGSLLGIRVLDKLHLLYEYVMWESNVLLALCGDDIIDPRSDFALEDLEKLRLPDEKITMQTKSKTWKVVQTNDNGMTSAMEALSTDPSVKMDIDSDDGADMLKAEDVVRPMPSANQLKYLNLVLATSSRLGRSIAELFGLLVKLCVGSPLRQRRGQVGNTTVNSTPYACEVASRLGYIMTSNINWRKFSEAPLPMLRMTYLMSTMGFTSSLIFDDKKFPYHLMLNEFVGQGGHFIFFETFRWVLNCEENSACPEKLENAHMPWGTEVSEFIENWLELLEKLVNPKTVLDSPHSLSAKANSTLPRPFDPLKYLISMQRMAFDALMLLWNADAKFQTRIGTRIMSVCLLIWRHILRAEKLIEERQVKGKELTSTASSATITTTNSTTTATSAVSEPRNSVNPPRNNEEAEPEVSLELLNRLVDMGFSRAMSIQALRISPTVEQATEYLLNTPSIHNMDMEVSEEDQVHQAIAMSLGESGTKSTGDAPDTGKKSNTVNLQSSGFTKPEEPEQLSKEALDKWSKSAPTTCLCILDVLGSTAVFRVCDLLVMIVKRNGNEFRDKMLRVMLSEVSDNVTTLLEQVKSSTETSEVVQILSSSEAAKKTAVRLHVFSLLFEEMKVPCAVAVQEMQIIDQLVALLKHSEPSFSQTHTPKWLAPMLLLLDLYEKVAISTERKEIMHKICNRQWQWYDIGTGKWCAYSATHNKLINQSYWAGEPSIRINYGRRKYTLQFSCMYQCNDETGNRRPIMMALMDKKQREQQTESTIPREKNEAMEVEETDLKDDKKKIEEEEVKHVFIHGIGDNNASILIASCVFMLGIPIENDALHAMLRICLRMTRKYEHAVQFAELGGVKLILNLTYASHFAGFVSLSTLLVRHVIEEPSVLRQAMEKVLRAKTQPNIPPPYKELFYMLRMCGNAICRDPEIFMQLSKETLQVDVGILSRRNEEEDTRLLLKMEPPSSRHSIPTPLNLNKISTQVISELLEALIVPVPGDTDDKEAGSPCANSTSSSCSVGSSQASQSPPVSRNATATLQQGLLGRQGLLRNSSSAEFNLQDVEEQDITFQVSERNKIEIGKSSPKKILTSEDLTRPLVPRSAVLKMLAEAVRSYSHVCSLIIDYFYAPNSSELITESCSALSFILDHLLQERPRSRDVECANMARMLIAALASCNHSHDTQSTLVSEVKSALSRTVALPESPEKHTQIQQLCSLISVMIDNCPAPTPPPGMANSTLKLNQCSVALNSIVRLMLRKGIIMDLARVPHCLDLSSPTMHVTVNAALKPLETLTRIVNHPIPPTPSNKNKNKSDTAAAQENGAQTAGGSTLSDATLAQNEDAPEDTENTDHDISAAAESLEPNSESHLAAEPSALEHMMEQILGGSGEQRLLQEMMEVEPSRTDSEITRSQQQPAQQQNQTTRNRMRGDFEDDDDDDDIVDEDDEEEEDDDCVVIEPPPRPSETTVSPTVPSAPATRTNIVDDDDDDDDDDDEEEEEEEDEDDEMEEEEEDEEEEEEEAEEDDSDEEEEEEDDEEDDDEDEEDDDAADLSPFLRLGVTSYPPQHPLLGFRTSSLDVGNLPPTRSQRSNRQRRYQYLQLHARQTNPPPVILQRLLGPGVHDLPLSTSQALASTFRDTRVVVMDSGLGLFNSEEDTGEGEQPGYLFGPSLAATLNNIPNALHWWNEEGKLLDGDSMPACVIAICAELVEKLEEQRYKEVSEKRDKKKKQGEDEEQKKKSETKSSSETPTGGTSRQQSALQMAASEISSIVDSVFRTSALPNLVANSGANDNSVHNSEFSENSSEVNASSSSQHSEASETAPSQSERQHTMLSDTSEDSSQITTVATSSTGTDHDAQGDDVATASSSEDQSNQSEQATVSVDSDTSTVPAPMETLSIPNSPSNSSNAAENLDQDPLANLDQDPLALPTSNDAVPQEAAISTGTGSTSTGGTAPMDMSRSFLSAGSRFAEVRANIDNVYEELDLDAAESWFRAQIEYQPGTSSSQGEAGTNNAERRASTPITVPAGGASNTATTADAPATTTPSTNSASAQTAAAEVPEGVDPSFLAALPEEMRQEVIAEQLRLQRLQQRARNALNAGTAEPASASVLEVNPEFLAALPPNIQEEVLTQQRLEQQRQAAAAANPNDPVDAAAFFQNLAPTLRQAILTDMEESQISVLPPELAAEAQNLRRDWEARNRQMMQDRFFSHVGHGSSALSSILRNPGRMAGRYAIHSVPQRQWARWGQPDPNGVIPGARYKGRLLLDQEAIACLLVLLFVDDPKLNIARLQRVLRNVCYHRPTRDWIFKALTSIVEKCNECHSPTANSLLSQQNSRMLIESCPRTNKLTLKQAAQSPDTQPRCDMRVPQPSWLNITMDAALGSRANVFYVQRPTGKKTTPDRQNTPSIVIHPQATSSVARHSLEMMVSLSKVFPIFYVPCKPKTHDKDKDKDEGKASTSNVSPGNAKSKQEPDFWDVLLKLDMMSYTKKGKSVTRTSLNAGAERPDPAAMCLNIESYNFQHLLCMLVFPLIKRNSFLTDRLLRLLNVAAQGLTEYCELRATIVQANFGERKNPDGSPATPPPVTYTKPVPGRRYNPKAETIIEIPEKHLKLAIDVLTSKRCSENGLNEATAFLLNVSSGPIATRDMILKLLLEGAKQLSEVVCSHIAVLMDELQALNKNSGKEKMGDAEEEANVHPERVEKGKLQDRFTKSTVVVTAPNKVKGGCELQLPSMAALTSKVSSQWFFLRILKVIIQLRGTIAHNAARLKYSAKKTTDSTAQPTTAAEGTTPAANVSAVSDMQADSENQQEGTSATSATENNSVGQELMDTAPADKPDECELPLLSEQLSVDVLWDTLSQCLLELEHTPDHYAVLVLQPAVEAFFLVHASSVDKESREESSGNGPASNENARTEGNSVNTASQELAPVSPLPGEGEASSSSASSASTNSSIHPVPQGSPQPLIVTLETSQPAILSSDTRKFLKFAEMHRTVLNQILRQSTVHLADGPFAVLVDHTRMLDFDVKRRYFRIELDRRDDGLRREELAVHVRRSHVFEDSFRELHRRSADEWKNRFYIVFEGEEGQDAGGLLREWYVIISREIFNPMYALFCTSPGDRVTYMINSTSHCNPNHLSYFKFVGRVIAKAIYDNKLLECYFTRSFYKHILGILVKYTDMESEDYSFYKGLVYLMEHHVTDLGYDLTFSTEVQEFGVTEVRDLIPNGRNIAVTENNKMDYVRLVCQMKMTGAIRKQLNAFLEGFYDIIPKRLISIFNEQELELLISGLPNVDIEDLKANTEYHKYQSTSLQIQWFWRALRSLDQADRAKFLQFVTGTSKVPLQGFGALEGMNGVQKFQIHRDDRSTDRLPSAHTCFNQLDLPVYETYDKLRSYLLKAIHECSEGFGFA